MRSFIRPVLAALLAVATLAACTDDSATSEGGDAGANPTNRGPNAATDGGTNPSAPAPTSGGADASTSNADDASTPNDAGNTTPTDSGTSTPTTPANITRACTGMSATTEHYGLPAPAAGPTGVSFLSDWSANAMAGGFPGIQAVDTCRYKLDAVFKTWHGKGATRIEVNPGDDPLNLGTERAEVVAMQTTAGAEIDESASSGTQYFALSYYFPTNWDATFLSGDGDSWSYIMQLHGSGSTVFGGLAVGRRTATDKQHLWYSTGSGDVAFSDGGAIVLGQWVDIVLEVDFKGSHLKIWRRNQAATSFSSVVDSAYTGLAAGTGIYFKQGLYRGPDVSGRTDVFWIGPTARGTSFLSVEGAAYGTSAGN